MRADSQRQNQICILSSNMAQWKEADDTRTGLLELELGLHDGVDPGIVVMTEHNSFRISGGARGVDERAAVARGLVCHSFLHLLLYVLSKLEVSKGPERFHAALVFGVASEVEVFRDDNDLP